LQTIIYPYLLWSVIQLATNRAMGRFTNGVPDASSFFTILYRPYAQFWFLFVLFALLVLVTPLLKLRHGAFVAMMAGALAYAVYPLAEALPWHPAAQMLRYFVYVALGAAAGPWLVRSGAGPFKRGRAGLIGVVAIVSLFWLFWRKAQISPLELGAASILGTAGVILFGWCIEHAVLGRVLEFLGRRSLEIYVAHVLGAAGMRIVLLQLGVASAPLHFILGVSAGVLLPLGLWWFASTFGIGFIFSLKRTVGLKAKPAMPVPSEVIAV
jgi:peptidoglycan/LPS O-acetylase OafA/YrhL